MRSKLFLIGIYGIVTASLLAGCAKKSAVEKTEAFQTAEATVAAGEELKETSKEELNEKLASMAETTAEDYSLAAVTNEAGETEYKYVPTKFEVFKDGESHKVMYGATAQDYYYSEFTNTSFPEYGIKSTSFPTSMVNPEKGRKVIQKGDMTSFLDFEDDVVYDTSARYSTAEKPVYSIENPYYVFRTWVVDYNGDPAKLTPEEMRGFYIDDVNGLDDLFCEQDQVSDGSHRYTLNGFFYDYPRKASYAAFGRYVTIIKDGKAYCYLFGAYDSETGYLFSLYALYHSFEFGE